MTSRGIVLALFALILTEIRCDTRYLTKLRPQVSDLFRTRSDQRSRVLADSIAVTYNPIYEVVRPVVTRDRMIASESSPQIDRRNSFETSTFDPDVLNKFLEDYANKIKSTTEKDFSIPFVVTKEPTMEPMTVEYHDQTSHSSTLLNNQNGGNNKDEHNSTLEPESLSDVLNDTLKRNKYYGSSSQNDRNGWVTLDAIPWSKSKISKWQANPSTQRPWPDMKPWDNSNSGKPWPNNDFPQNPQVYENNKPVWYEKPKPHWHDSNGNGGNEKPWYKPQVSRPSHYGGNDDDSNQAEKWPPERPSQWNGPSRPVGSDIIITDDGPSNFPNYKPPSRPNYSNYGSDRYPEKAQASESIGDWQEFPSRFGQSNDRPRPSSTDDRPHFSHYQYANNNYQHPPSHPANGEGQWVLLSTNRGYSKSRQRSIKIDSINPDPQFEKLINITRTKVVKKEANDPAIPVMTSKRQVRLTVLPSINGTNTTTSHGGLLEVEKTFKSVDQSRNEYERNKLTSQSLMVGNRPTTTLMANTHLGAPSSSAVLAAVGAGMLPATMAMMIPMMLGRRKRDLRDPFLRNKRALLNFDPRVRYFTH